MASTGLGGKTVPLADQEPISGNTQGGAGNPEQNSSSPQLTRGDDSFAPGSNCACFGARAWYRPRTLLNRYRTKLLQMFNHAFTGRNSWPFLPGGDHPLRIVLTGHGQNTAAAPE
ncbi:MAG: hypothetical protein QOJ99_6174 [Bryobacterales bacterium]|nr:hypothetical protein [Bryobacterales bacterium]